MPHASAHTLRQRSMSKRARWYLTIAATRHLLTAGVAIFVASSFRSTSFDPIINAAPLWMWGVVFAGAGLACGIGAWRGSARIARLGLMWSASSTLMVGVGLVAALYTRDLQGPTAPILWLAVAAKDFTVCTDPLCTPLEDFAHNLVAPEAP